jgi:4-hydroxy-2-oxoheptanedioate aldolase
MSLFSFSPTIAEAVGYFGIDYLFVDNEHGPASWETLENIMRACDVSGISAMLRVDKQYPGYPSNIRRAFEIGASMVLVPHINSRQEAMAVVRAARFGPDWKADPPGDQVRGSMVVSRSGRYGNIPLPDFTRMENEHRLVAVQIEEPRAVENAEEIMSVDGIARIDLGPADLTTCLGIPGKTSDPKVQEMLAKVAELEKKYKKIKSANIDFLGALVDREAVKRRIKEQLREGASLFELPGDISILRTIIGKCKEILDESYNEFVKEGRQSSIPLSPGGQ